MASPSSLLAPRYRGVTIGILSLIFSAAFNITAVTAIMPTIATDLGGQRHYALAFSTVLAASLMGMVLGGMTADRRGPRIPVIGGAALFGVALLGCAFVTSLDAFLLLRLLQGFGEGAMIVALYTLIGTVYPAALRPRVFAAFATMWVIPALVGPFIAGALTEAVGWQVVFLTAAGVVFIAIALLWRLLTTSTQPTRPATSLPWMRIGAGAGLAAAALALNAVPELTGGTLALAFLGLGVVIALLLRPVVPRGTFTASTPAGALVLTRALCDGSFYAAEVYVPLLLARRDGLPPTLTGLSLTAAGVTWFLASQYQARRATDWSLRRTALIGISLLLLCYGGLVLLAIVGGHFLIAVVLWGIGGFGMGLCYPRISAEALDVVPTTQHGFIGSALQISSSVASACGLALTAVVMALTAEMSYAVMFASVFTIALAAAVLLAVVWWRYSPTPATPTPQPV